MAREQSAQAESEGSKSVFDEFVFKLGSRCSMQPPEPSLLHRRQLLATQEGRSLGCDQCYEFERNSDWKKQPPSMEPATIRRAAERIAEHAEGNGLNHIRAIAHGGEPLMRRGEYLDEYATILREVIEAPGRQLHLGVQTNGLHLSDEKVGILEKHNFTVGLSLDGNRRANDRHRRTPLGESTYDRVVEAALKLGRSSLDWGFLTVIDTRNGPEETLDALAALGPNSITMFPPHANHSHPPKQHEGAMSLGEWQIRVFEHYRTWEKRTGEKRDFTMPLVRGYLAALLGAAPTHERISNRYPQELFFLPNGDVQRLDTLKTTEGGAYRTSYNVFDATKELLNEVSRNDAGFAARRLGDAALSEECRGCIFKTSCGGDYYPTRFKAPEKPLGLESAVEEFAEAFRHPGIYCDDQKEYLGHLGAYVVSQQEALKRKIPVKSIWYDGKLSFEGGIQYSSSSLVKIASSCSRYHKFPLGEPQAFPEVSEAEFEELFSNIAAGKISGRIALHIIANRYERYSLHNRKLLFQSRAAKAPFNDTWTNEGLTADLDEAIMRALFHSENAFLKDVNFKLRRSEGYWFVTANAANALAHFHSQGIRGNSFVSPILLSRQIAENHLAGTWTKDDDEKTARQQKSPYPSSIAVALADAPGDILLVDHKSNNPTEMIAALDFSAALLSEYPTPQALANTYEIRKNGIEITPLCGRWPKNWLL